MRGSDTTLLVVYDASVLHPAPLRDLLIRVATAGLAGRTSSSASASAASSSAVWTSARKRLARTRALMIDAVPDCLLRLESLIPHLDLPYPDDRHVLAAAIHGRAQVIITANLDDFPVAVLER